MATTPTPTPWRVEPKQLPHRPFPYLVGRNHQMVVEACDSGPKGTANMELVALATEHHHELVDVVREYLHSVKDVGLVKCDDRARAVLARLEAK